MNIPLPIKCSKCGEQENYFISLDEMDIKDSCKCGNNISGFLDNSFTTGVKLLYRSRFEYLTNNDYSLSIVFSAMALECDIARLFFKWRDIENIKEKKRLNDDDFEEELRKFGTIDNKIDSVALLMYPSGISEFISQNDELATMIVDGFKSVTIDNFSKDIRTELFWKRNKILHRAKVDYGSEVSKVCYNIAQIGIRVFAELDDHKINTT